MPTATHTLTSMRCGGSISTITTAGYGDITPQTPAGRAVAALTMVVGDLDVRSRDREDRRIFGTHRPGSDRQLVR